MTLRSRLLIVLGVLVATYVVAAMVILSTQRSMLIDQVDNVLMTLPPGAVAGLGAPPPGPQFNQQGSTSIEGGGPGVGGPTESPFTDIYIAAFGDGEPVLELLTSPTIGSPPDIEEAVKQTAGAQGIVTVRAVEGGARFRALVIPSPGEERWHVAAQPLAETDAAVARLQRTLVIAGVVIFAVLGVASFWIYRLGLLPIARVTAAAEAIAAGDRTRRLDVGRAETEAGKLGVAFNVMLDERDAGENRLRQFVADASHELRTPITSVRGYLELFRQGAFREQTQVDDVVRRLSAEAARMNGLVEDLLALASLDEGRPLRQEPVDLGQIVRDAAQDAGATQPDRRIEVDAPVDGPVIVGDESLLIQLVNILVANALAHTPSRYPSPSQPR